MSQWTHVNSSIRIDSLRSLETERTDCLRNIPTGSEGALDVHIWVNPNISCINAYVYTIFGDLRDFGNEKDVESIIEFFNEITKKEMIRSAFFEIDIDYPLEDKPSRLFVYDHTEKIFIEVFRKDITSNKGG